MNQADKERIVWAALSAGAVIGASMVARKGADRAWRQLRGDAPPQDVAEPANLWRDLILWAGASGLSVALARFVAQGVVSKLWRKRLGRRPPGA